jgi:hypothetical protein
MPTPVQARVHIRYVKFFRSRLLALDNDSIAKMVDAMEQETIGIRREILKLCWYMRGGVSYDEAMQMSQQERAAMSEIVKENLETTKKTNLPFF